MPRPEIPNYEKLPRGARARVDLAQQDSSFALGHIVGQIEFMQMMHDDCRSERVAKEKSHDEEIEALKSTRWKLLGAIGLLCFFIPVLVTIAIELVCRLN